MLGEATRSEPVKTTLLVRWNRSLSGEGSYDLLLYEGILVDCDRNSCLCGWNGVMVNVGVGLGVGGGGNA